MCVHTYTQRNTHTHTHAHTQSDVMRIERDRLVINTISGCEHGAGNKTMAYQIEVDFSLYLRKARDNRLAQKSNGTRQEKKRREMRREIANALQAGILICDRGGIW